MSLVVLSALKKFPFFLFRIIVDWVFVKVDLKFSEVGVFYLFIPETFPIVFIFNCLGQPVYLYFFFIT